MTILFELTLAHGNNISYNTIIDITIVVMLLLLLLALTFKLLLLLVTINLYTINSQKKT